MKLAQIKNIIDSDYQVRINNPWVFRKYCSRYADEITDVEKIVNDLGFRDYDYKTAIWEIVSENPNHFRKAGNEIVLMTTNLDRLINLELSGIRAEGDTIIFIVTYERYKGLESNSWSRL